MALPLQAQAGRSCEQVADHGPDRQGHAVGRAHRRRRCQRRPACVAMRRAGPEQVRPGYSHPGIAKTDEGPWRVVHKLNRAPVAAVYRQGLGEFFLDTRRHEAVTPTPQVQTQLGRAQRVACAHRAAARRALQHRELMSGARSTRSRTAGLSKRWPRPWSSPPSATAQAQAWMQFKGYEPTTLSSVRSPAWAAEWARLTWPSTTIRTTSGFRTDETVTVDSVFAWIRGAGCGAGDVCRRR